MQIRGCTQEGLIAEIIIFDYEKDTDCATCEMGLHPPMGTPHVLVNGTIVIRHSPLLKGVNHGQAIWYEPYRTDHYREQAEEPAVPRVLAVACLAHWVTITRKMMGGRYGMSNQSQQK